MTPDMCMRFLVWSYYYHDIVPTPSMSYAHCGKFAQDDAERLDTLKEMLFKCFEEQSVVRACQQFQMAKVRQEPCPFTQAELDHVFAPELTYMQMAIEEALAGIRQGHGGPFGSVIVKDGKVIARGHNRVLIDHDPTAHGEMMAIRQAGKVLGTHDLTGCTLYTTGEPCHMCLCAILWANIDKVYYGCTIADNGRIGFRDDKFNDIFGGRDRLTNLLHELDRDQCLKLFDTYNSLQHTTY